MATPQRQPPGARSTAVHDWRLVPSALCAWAGAWLGTGVAGPPGRGWAWWTALVVLVGAVAWAVRLHRYALAAAATVGLVCAVAATVRAESLHQGLPAQVAHQRAAARVLVRLSAEPVLLPARAGRPPLAVARARLVEMVARGRLVRASQPVVLMASGKLADELVRVRPGSVHLVSGMLASSEPDAPEALVVRVRSVSDELAPPGPLDEFVNGLRAGLRSASAHSPPLQAALLPSLVVGDTAGVTSELSEQFRTTSLSHLLAVSGSNLALAMGVVLMAARVAGVRGWWVRGVGAVFVGFFVVVCRGEPSVVRAAAMGLVGIGALGLGRGRRSMRHLALAVLCLMFVDPWLSRSWGFALSAAACAGLVVWGSGWVQSMQRWAPRWLAEALAIPLAAQLATQPMTVALSGQVSVVGVVANALAAPFVGPATVLGLVAMSLTFLPVAATAVAWLAGWCVQPIIAVAQLGSSLPSAAWSWPASPAGIALASVGSVAAAALGSRVLARRWSTVALLAIMVLASFWRPAPLGWPGRWQVAFCDVGQGDATVLGAGHQTAILVDTGPDPRPLAECLASLGVQRLPVVVLTHYHADHVGGVRMVLQRFRPDLVLVSPLASPAHTAEAVRREAEASGARVREAAAGERYVLGQVSVQVINAWSQPGTDDAGAGESSVENDSSVVTVAQIGQLRVLLPGDAEPAAQTRALAAAAERGVALGTHVLKLPHHGSSRQDPAFFRATGASLAVASAGLDNEYGHPSQKALSLAGELGMDIARTDRDGSVAVGLERGRLRVVREHPG